MRAFLRSKRVNLRMKTRYLMKMGGLKKLDDIYEEEKSGRGRSRTTSSATRVPASDELKRLIALRASQTLTRVFKDGVAINGVATIVKASYGYKSLTSKMTNVTEGVRAALGQSGVGELRLTQDDLIRLRNRGSEAGADVDNLRGGLLQVATLGMAGKVRSRSYWS